MSDDSLELRVEVPARRRTDPVLRSSFTAEDGFGRWFELRDQTLEEDDMSGVVPLLAVSCCARDINTMSVLPIWEEYEAEAQNTLINGVLDPYFEF